MSKSPETRLAIARTGTFTDSAGNSHSFTTEDLDAIAASYDPKTLEAPLVFGHPATGAPAYGWVTDLKREGSTLFAQFAQVPGTVRDLVAQGHYKYVSMSLMPDKKRLRHVGLLGAAVPAIEGLGAVQFEGAEGITINFSNSEEPMDEEMKAMLEAMKAELARLKTELEAMKGQKVEAEKKSEETAAEFAAFKSNLAIKARADRVNALINAGKLAPAKKDEVLSFAAALAQVSVPVEFAAADGTKEQISPEERYLRELEARPVDERFTDFSALAAPAGQPVTVNAAEMVKKL